MVFKRVDLSYVDLPCVEEVTVRNSREDFALLWLDERRGDIRGLGSDILLNDSERRSRGTGDCAGVAAHCCRGSSFASRTTVLKPTRVFPRSLFCRYTVEPNRFYVRT